MTDLATKLAALETRMDANTSETANKDQAFEWEGSSSSRFGFEREGFDFHYLVKVVNNVSIWICTLDPPHTSFVLLDQ